MLGCLTELWSWEESVQANVTLETAILTAFERALADDHIHVAEHLLRALEALQPDLGPGTERAFAYLEIAALPRWQGRH
jgi:hypothetical protein